MGTIGTILDICSDLPFYRCLKLIIETSIEASIKFTESFRAIPVIIIVQREGGGAVQRAKNRVFYGSQIFSNGFLKFERNM